MRKNLFPLIATGLLGAVASLSPAQDWTLPLGETSIDALPADAREVYEQAWERIDRVGYDTGVALLNRAASMAPANKSIQFYTINRAINRARVYYSAASFSDLTNDFFNPELRRATQPPWLVDEIFIEGSINAYTTPPWRIAESFLDLAEASADRLDQLDTLTDEEVNRLQSVRSQITVLRNTFTERDAARQESAKPIKDMVLRERREAFMRKVDPLDPKNFFDVEYEDMLRGIEEAEEVSLEESTEYNPFATLPGEYREPIIPPQMQPGFGQGFQPQPIETDEFGRPIGAPGMQPGFEPGMEGFGPPPQQQPQPDPGFDPGFDEF